ncbi:MAG: hypothetical protein IJA91_05050 [Clostridia bacterium]|nr:hypothetical protein [Clostridia bacterium]
MESKNLNPRLTVHRMCRLTVLVSAVCFAITSLVLAPIYIKFASNILYSETWWVYLLYYLTEEGMVDLVVFAVCYPAAIYAVWQAGLKGAIRVPVSFACITLVKFIANFFMTSIVDGALPNASDFFSFDLPYIGTLFFLEMLQYALVILMTWLIKRRYTRKSELAEAEAMLPMSQNSSRVSELFAFSRLLSMKNPIQLSAFLMGVLIFVFRFSMHQIYQYTLYITSGYTDGLVIMALDLLSDIFVAVIFYFVALLLLTRFHRKDLEVASSEA